MYKLCTTAMIHETTKRWLGLRKILKPTISPSGFLYYFLCSKEKAFRDRRWARRWARRWIQAWTMLYRNEKMFIYIWQLFWSRAPGHGPQVTGPRSRAPGHGPQVTGPRAEVTGRRGRPKGEESGFWVRQKWSSLRHTLLKTLEWDHLILTTSTARFLWHSGSWGAETVTRP